MRQSDGRLRTHVFKGPCWCGRKHRGPYRKPALFWLPVWEPCLSGAAADRESVAVALMQLESAGVARAVHTTRGDAWVFVDPVERAIAPMLRQRFEVCA